MAANAATIEVKSAPFNATVISRWSLLVIKNGADFGTWVLRYSVYPVMLPVVNALGILILLVQFVNVVPAITILGVEASLSTRKPFVYSLIAIPLIVHEEPFCIWIQFPVPSLINSEAWLSKDVFTPDTIIESSLCPNVKKFSILIIVPNPPGALVSTQFNVYVNESVVSTYSKYI